MPGVTLTSLVDEAMTFDHDYQLLGISDSDSNEPHGDSFEDRIRAKLGYRWFDSRDPKGEVLLESLDENDGEEGDDNAPPTQFELYCAMSLRNQATFLATLKARICNLIGVSYFYWEPSDALVLDAIQDDTPDDILREQAYAEYLATPLPDERNPSDEPETNGDLAHYEGDVSISQQGGYSKNNGLRREAEEYKGVRVEREIRETKGDHSRSRVSNSRRRTCFYRARRETMRRNWDFYNEDPHEIDEAARDAALEALFASDVDMEPEPEVMASTWSPALPWDCETEEELADAANEMHVWVTTGRRPWWSYQPSYSPHDYRFDDFYDDFDDYPMDFDRQYDEVEAVDDGLCGDPHCVSCGMGMGYREDIFEDYGNTGAVIDQCNIGYMSAKHGSYRYLGTPTKAERRLMSE